MKDYQVLIKMTYLCEFFPEIDTLGCGTLLVPIDHRHTVLPLKQRSLNWGRFALKYLI